MAAILTDHEESSILFAAEQSAGSIGLHALRVHCRGTRSRPIIEVVLDGERWVTLNDCESISKELQPILDDILGKGCNYRLDVTSPGVDEPLKEEYQYRKATGKMIQLTLIDGTLRKGILGGIDNDYVMLQPPKMRSQLSETVKVPRADIKKAHLIIQFS